MAASVTAMLLARAGKSCVILERGDDSGDKPGESLPPSARPLLEQLGLWDALEADGHRPCHGNRSRWGSDVVEELPFVFSPYGHGWHLDRRRFERLLISRCGAERRTGTRVVEVDGRWRFRCNDGSTVESQFAVDATGRAAWLARRK
jgi:2-polyprenyl-6-methoxyphenol hydroxylase-like FAD-dependent oxidoreductase